MVRSMTGYGRAQDIVDGLNITVELKAVNHRYFEFSSRVSRAYGFLDEKIKSYIKSAVARGKIECYVQIEALEAEDADVTVNTSLAAGYITALQSLAESYEIRNDISVMQVARFQDVLSVHKAEADEEQIWNAVRTVAGRALEAFLQMREAEGEKLKADILGRADAILEHVAVVEERSPQTVAEYNAKLTARIQEVLADTAVDEQRILTEAAIFADKVAVAEETVRLRSHMEQLRNFFELNEPVGRKLDFLVQEINREANTIGSKAQDIAITRRVVEMKSEVEKIREQVQNIE